MKICLVSNLYNPDIIGGAENVVAGLANRLADEGHEVLVIATKQSAFVPIYQGLYKGDERAIIFFVHMENLRAIISNGFRNALLTPIWHALDIWNPHSYYYVRQTIKDFAPDIINTHNIFGMSTAVWSAARSLKIPLVHTLYDYSLLCPKTTRFKSGQGACQSSCSACSAYSVPKRWFTGCVAAVIAPSQQLLDIFKTREMFQTKNQYVIPHGIEETQQQCLVEPWFMKFLCVGQISEHKGILTLIKAFMRLRGRKAVLNVVGLGDCLRTAQRLAAGDERIIFHHFVEGEAKEALFLNNSVLVVPSLWEEPFGQAILEAYSRGMPVIASKIGGLSALVDDGKTGFLVEPGDEADLAQKIETFIDDRDLAKSMTENCVNKAKDFGLEQQVKKYCEVYENVLASAKKRN